MEYSPEPFVHLHVHSQYSLLDGACRTADLPRRAKELGQSSLAITDHGAMFGIVDFYQRCVGEGVKPIIGMEAYMAPGDRRDRTYTGVKDGGYHLLLLAENRTGYQNLLKLASTAYLDGFYFKPRIDKNVLAEHSEGIIGTSACLGGEIPTALTKSDRKRAKELAETYIQCFGKERFFIELQSHIPEQAAVNPELMDLADRLGVGAVATNDVHFLLPEDHAPHDALCCISTGKLVSDESRMKYPTQLYLKDGAEMRIAGADLGDRWREACDNTIRIADMCDLDLDFSANHAPVVKIEKRETEQARAEEIEGENKQSLNIKPQKTSPAAGSTEWFQRFCSRFELLPFDSDHNTESEEDLKRYCDNALRELVEAGATWRYGRGGITDAIRARIDRELKVLADKSISAYFLICWDFVSYARSRGIPANARGSGVGTMVGYCLGLSNACPVKYGLLFERFTDPDRSEYPDIDIDICQNGRAEVIDYVRRKYGHVAQIITFGTLKARAVIRDVGRVMDVPLPEVDRIAKLVPGDLGMTLNKALDAEEELRREYESQPQTKRLIDTGARLEGLARHASVHAAGVVVATQPLHNIIPLYKDPRSNGKNKATDADPAAEAITQWDGPTCEKVGLLKMDFLGLRTLSIIERAKELVDDTLKKETQRATIRGEYGAGAVPDTPREFGLTGDARDEAAQDSKTENKTYIDPLDLERLTFVDQNVLDLFRRGETAGVFQFESGGMRSLLVGMRPDRLEDLIAANALFRPGPMDLIPDYNDRKLGRADIPSVHPIVDKFTAETYGVMVYQEQVMQIIHELGGIPLREAYTIIKAISKKKHKVIDAAREKFIAGAQEQDLPKKQAEDLFELILKFAGYGFNKSHSTGYAIVAYQTAYLKTYFPIHYMAALLTFESVSTDKVTEYIEACRRIRLPDGRAGVEVRPPDINRSFADFTVVYEKGEPREPNRGHIRFGLGAVKGVGGKAIETIIKARADRPFTGLFDFCERVPQGLVNKGVIEALVKCGAFDELHGVEKRAALVAAIDHAMTRGAQEAELSSSDDFLFGTVASDHKTKTGNQKSEDDPQLPAVESWTAAHTLSEEKSVLGFFVSSHPLDEHRRTLRRFTSAGIQDACRLRADVEVTIGGMIARIRRTVTRARQEKMAILTVEDRTGSIDAVAFPRTYAEHAHLLEAERIVLITGKIDRRRDEPNLIIDCVIPIEEAPRQLTRGVRIILRDGRDGPQKPSAGNGEVVDGMDNGGPRNLPMPNTASNSNSKPSPRQWNGELTALRTMLRQSPGMVPVYFELRCGEKSIILRSERYRIQAAAELPQRIATILRDRDCCHLIGPADLVQQAPDKLLTGDEPAVADRLIRPSGGGEVCDSIDRY